MNRRDILSSLMALPAVAAVKAAPEVIGREPTLAEEMAETAQPPSRSHPIIIFKMTQQVRHDALTNVIDGVHQWAAAVNWPRQHILVLPYEIDATVVPGGPPVNQDEAVEDWKRVMEEKNRKRRERMEKLVEELKK